MIKEIRFEKPPRHDSWGRNGFITTTGVEISSLGEPVADRDATVLFAPITSNGLATSSCRVCVATAALPQVIAALQSLLEQQSCPPRETGGTATRYLVRWEIDIEAETPLAAAQKARHYQTKPDTTAQVFDVFAPLYDPPEPAARRCGSPGSTSTIPTHRSTSPATTCCGIPPIPASRSAPATTVAGARPAEPVRHRDAAEAGLDQTRRRSRSMSEF